MPAQSLLVKAQAAITRTYSRALDALPILSPQALDLLELELGDPKADRVLMRIIESDPGYSARLLGLANSPLYRRNHQGDEVCTAAQAFSILGSRQVLETGLAHYFSCATPQPHPAAKAHRTAIWRHSLLVAFASREQARSVLPEKASALFGAGLMHDLGLIVLEHLNFKGYSEVLAEALRRQCDPILLEQELLGVTHEELGALVGKAWRLPETLLTCIQAHHNPPAEANPIQKMVSKADTAARHPAVAAVIYQDLGEPYACPTPTIECSDDLPPLELKLVAQANWVVTQSNTLTCRV